MSFQIGSKKQVALGFFVLVGIAVFFVAIFFVGSDKTLFQSTFKLVAEFDDAQGLRKGANVWLNGVKVGIVSNVDIVRDSTVRVTVKVKERYRPFVKADAVAQLAKQGLIGTPLIVILPGKKDSTVSDGQRIASLPDGNRDLVESLRRTEKNVEKITADLKQLFDDAEAGQGLIGELFTDQQLASSVKDAALKIEVTGKNTATITGDLKSILKHLKDNKGGPVSALLTDTSFSTVYHQTLTNLRVTSKNTAELTGDFEQLLKQATNTKGAVGLMLADTAFAQNLRSSSENLNQDLAAMKHNFLLRGFFKKQQKPNEHDH